MFVKDIVDDRISHRSVSQLSGLELVNGQSTIRQVSVYRRYPCALIPYDTYFRGCRTWLRQNLHRFPSAVSLMA